MNDSAKAAYRRKTLIKAASDVARFDAASTALGLVLAIASGTNAAIQAAMQGG